MSARNRIRIKVLSQMAGGLVACSIPVAIWWKFAADERRQLAEDVRTRIRLPGLVQTTDDLLIEKCQPGDVIVFDRRCDKCATSPWAAVACLAQKRFLCGTNVIARSVEEGTFDHIGLVVPGYINDRTDEFDASNLLLFEATPQGIVARPLKTRLERTMSRSVILLQLCSPAEKRNMEEDFEQLPSVKRARSHVERELRQFRDRWIALSEEKNYKWIHSTVGVGGAVAYGMGMQDYLSGPICPSAYIVLLGLHQAAAAQSINEKENRAIKVEDFLRDYRFSVKDAVRLRPGWRFLAPIRLRETSKS